MSSYDDQIKTGELVRTTGLSLPADARDQTLPGKYRIMYNQLLNEALEEFPPIEGYETTHKLLSERLVYFFVQQKKEENEPVIVDIKRYRANIGAFLRTVEALLKEARSISAEATFKHNFIRQVMEVLDRCIGDQNLKAFIAKELDKVANQNQ